MYIKHLKGTIYSTYFFLPQHKTKHLPAKKIIIMYKSIKIEIMSLLYMHWNYRTSNEILLQQSTKLKFGAMSHLKSIPLSL